VAQSGRRPGTEGCPLSGAKQTLHGSRYRRVSGTRNAKDMDATASYDRQRDDKTGLAKTQAALGRASCGRATAMPISAASVPALG
jgi:hypothetical protein